MESFEEGHQSLSSSFFERLPFDLYCLLHSFLSHSDYRRCLASNKFLFQDIKLKTSYFNLNLFASLRFIQNPNFRRTILSRVQNKSTQVSIYLSLDYYDIKSRYFYCYIAGLHSVNIDSLHFDAFLSYLKHISILRLENGRDIEDFPYLPTLKRLTLKKFQNLRRIVHLSHLEEVQLMSCPLVADVSPLRAVKTVSLEDCPSVHSIEALGLQQRLSLIRCAEISSVSSLGMVRYLTISQCLKIDDLSFSSSSSTCSSNSRSRSQDIYQLQLINLPTISTLPDLSHLKEVIVQNCPQIVDYRQLPSSLLRIHLINSFLTELSPGFSLCQSVKLVGCPYLEDVSALATVSRVHLEKCWKVTEVATLGKVIKLTLIDLPMIVSLAGLGTGNHRISLGQCPSIEDFNPLQAIPDVHLFDLSQAIDLSVFSLTRCLSIENCLNLLHLSRLQQFCPCLQTLRLVRCRNVSDLHDLWKIPLIIVQHCPNLIDLDTGPSASFLTLPSSSSFSHQEKGQRTKRGGERRDRAEKIVYEGHPFIHTIKIYHS